MSPCHAASSGLRFCAAVEHEDDCDPAGDTNLGPPREGGGAEGIGERCPQVHVPNDCRMESLSTDGLLTQVLRSEGGQRARKTAWAQAKSVHAAVVGADGKCGRDLPPMLPFLFIVAHTFTVKLHLTPALKFIVVPTSLLLPTPQYSASCHGLCCNTLRDLVFLFAKYFVDVTRSHRILLFI